VPSVMTTLFGAATTYMAKEKTTEVMAH
jgi:hypothetical protein